MLAYERVEILSQAGVQVQNFAYDAAEVDSEGNSGKEAKTKRREGPAGATGQHRAHQIVIEIQGEGGSFYEDRLLTFYQFYN